MSHQVTEYMSFGVLSLIGTHGRVTFKISKF